MPRANEYEHEFKVLCPRNGDLISYRLFISAEHQIRYDDIRKYCAVPMALQEDLADELFEVLGGTQTLTGKHGEMWVRTKRSP